MSLIHHSWISIYLTCCGFGPDRGGSYELCGEHSLVFNMLTAIEKIMEMAGTVLFIYVLTSYMDSELKCSRFRIMSIPGESHNCTGKH